MHENTKHPHERHTATQRGQRRGCLHVRPAARPYVFLCVLLYTGFTSLQFHQGTRLGKRTLVMLHLLSEPTVNSEWRTNCSFSFSLDIWPTGKRYTVLLYTTEVPPGLWLPAAGRFRIHSSDIRHRGRHPPFPSGFSVREGSTRCWAENIWRRRG